MNLWAKKDKCCYKEKFLFQIFKNYCKHPNYAEWNEWKTQEKKKTDETLKDIYNADTTEDLLEG